MQYPLSLYGRIQLLQLNDFWVVLVLPLIIGYSPMVAPSVALSADHTGAPNVEKHGEELADSVAVDHPNFTVCNNIIRCVYRAELILGR